MQELNTLTDGLLDELKDLFSAENQLLKALPEMEKKAANQNLKQAFKEHLKETESQIERLEEVAEMLNEKLSGKTCKAMRGLIEEGKEVLEEESENEALLDALLIGAAQRVEHYEIAGYNTAIAMATELGRDDIVGILRETLEEEMSAERKLSGIAFKEVLPEANNFSEDEVAPSMNNGGIARKAHVIRRAGNTAKFLILAAGFLVANSLVSSVYAESAARPINSEKGANNYNADDTGRNVRDRNDSRVTADSQGEGSKDIEVLATIRKEVVANSKLSTNGQNVKIMVDKGIIVLRGPVKSDDEKSWIERTAKRVSPGYKVVNELEVAPS